MGAIERSRELAETMVALGTDAGVKVSALITSMEAPLGYAIGNANEVRESVEVLAGGGPSDIVELTVETAREMLAMVGIPDADVEGHLRDGKAMDVWRKFVIAQGGDPDAPLPVAPEQHEVRAERDGVVVAQDAYKFGVGAWRLGAGRARAADPVVHSAGIDLAVKPGDAVRKGDLLYTLHAENADRFALALDSLDGALELGEPGTEVSVTPLIAERIQAN